VSKTKELRRKRKIVTNQIINHNLIVCFYISLKTHFMTAEPDLDFRMLRENNFLINNPIAVKN